MKEGGPKEIGIEAPREAPHVSFPPLKPKATSLPRAKSRHEKSMPIMGSE